MCARPGTRHSSDSSGTSTRGLDAAQVFEEGRDTCVDDHCPESRCKCQKRVYVDMQARLKYLCDARAAGTKTVEEMLDGVGHLIRL